jgi:predicted nucleic acid-binding protein
MNPICDTSFVAHVVRGGGIPRGCEGWNGSILGELEESTLAVSIVTVAEARAGYLNARWGSRRLAAAEEHLRRFRWIPVGPQHADEWARLCVAARRRGVAIGTNDLWIAATASVGEGVLVTCDRDHLRIAEELPGEVLYLAPPR